MLREAVRLVIRTCWLGPICQEFEMKHWFGSAMNCLAIDILRLLPYALLYANDDPDCRGIAARGQGPRCPLWEKPERRHRGRAARGAGTPATRGQTRTSATDHGWRPRTASRRKPG